MQATSNPERHIVYTVPERSLLFGVKVRHEAAAELAELSSAFPATDRPRCDDPEFCLLMSAFADEVRS